MSAARCYDIVLEVLLRYRVEMSPVGPGTGGPSVLEAW